MSEDSKVILETEWSYLLDTEKLVGESNKISISPDDEARKRLAQRLGIVSVDSLKADITVSHGSGEVAFHVTGHFDAKLTQNCVVTLDPVPADVSDDFESWFMDPDATVSIAKARREKLNENGHGELLVLDERDDPEPMVDGKIDLGELVTQYLSLAVDLYPHGEGVSFEQPGGGKLAANTEDIAKNPFAALKDWKDKLTPSED